MLNPGNKIYLIEIIYPRNLSMSPYKSFHTESYEHTLFVEKFRYFSLFPFKLVYYPLKYRSFDRLSRRHLLKERCIEMDDTLIMKYKFIKISVHLYKKILKHFDQYKYIYRTALVSA